MSTGDGNPTHIPARKMEPRGFYIKAQFHPNIKMARKGGLKFADALCECIEFDSFELKSDRWSYSQSVAGTDGRISVVVMPAGIQIHATHPISALEWFETRLPLVFENFATIFKPKMSLGSSAMIRGTVQVDGDARTFIANNLLQDQLIERSGFKRPVHLLGLRFFFPPYKKATKSKKKEVEETNWGVNVRLESLLDDPTKLFLEADAEWPMPQMWSDSTASELVGHLTTVQSYINGTLIPMLAKNSKPNDDEPESGNTDGEE